MTALSVNLNRVALLRNSRPLHIPSVTHAATLVLEAGADGITLHPRPDERHVRPADVREVAQLLRQWPNVEYNLEGNPLHQLMEHVQAVRPAQCTFVPDAIDAATSDHGWDLRRDGERLRPLIVQAHDRGARVSLFMDPEPEQMALARALGADRVELYTEPYARAHGTAAQSASLERYRVAAEAALRAGLEVNAGHDLNLLNLRDFLRAVPGVREVSIGHALISDALEFGLAHTVRLYQAQIRQAEVAWLCAAGEGAR
ncbi:MAG TPA: pyridoxine 5'-phosphate synthase [Burkholderiaceae bacterium]|nr:pyridoxine 5'-phosphate synthase [Burkholderiaceae bacterium]